MQYVKTIMYIEYIQISNTLYTTICIPQIVRQQQQRNDWITASKVCMVHYS
jgi:hypothetical protein